MLYFNRGALLQNEQCPKQQNRAVLSPEGS